ncbi:MAG: RNA polymerase-binding protein DksA [Gammaproteobacteria bacterium]|nr:MAG: RNA polymerase-binding protein DksA [Gammaproteobacteria bacterium]
MATRKTSSRKTTVRKAAKTAGRKISVKKKAGSRKAAGKKVARKSSSRKKASAKKKPASKAARKASKKKAVARKKPASKAARKASKKKVARKAVAKKTSASRTRQASAKKKTAARSAGRKAAAKNRRRIATGKTLPADALIHGIPPYQPKPGEEYMSDAQLEHFRQILLAWKRELMEEVDRTVHHMQDEASNFPDPTDRATQESEFGLELRTRDRERKLLKKIDAALARIDDGSYGYCEETGEEIGLKRLEARPVATLSVEAQERRELAERQYRDRDDQYR